ncbi:hypothetical protein ACFWAT_14155 [Streptomyces syringium]|uniref:hypothetical protein n=1 Tax=Streptomyces syringium TaxID=76729 RepID=UPI003653888E
MYRDKNGDENVDENAGDAWESGTPFADLVRDAQAAGPTWRELSKRAIDRRTGYQISHSGLWKIAEGQPVKVSPPLVRAVAAMLCSSSDEGGRSESEREREEARTLRRVQLAAAQQYIGLMADDPVGASTQDATVVVAHVPGLTAGDMPRVQDLLSQWASGGGSERMVEAKRSRR